jgi:Ni,Fe-hydrogenase III large subunit
MPEVPTTVEPYPFVPVKGTGVYEIPVGPVHAGLIEPGHFRFWVVGETILRMKARLWFLHKGIERLFEGRAIADGMELAEKISGDTAVGHGVAYCLAVEEATRTVVAPGAQVIRSILLELERFVNHVSDMGALGNDAGFGLANAWALDLREFMLGLNREITGHRLLRGGVVLGGARVQRLPTGHELEEARERFEEIVDLVSGRSFVIERFTGTAILSGANAQDLGVIGPAGRASGLAFDARVAHPFCDFGTDLTQCVGSGGDVLARYQLRVAEARAALNLVETLINRVGELEVIDELGSAHGSGVGIVEAWRGAAVHRVELAGDGRLARVKIVDPSFLNWPAVPVSLANTIVPDFPLANKSFNLSYAGNDL